jgi:hypothetical protein
VVFLRLPLPLLGGLNVLRCRWIGALLLTAGLTGMTFGQAGTEMKWEFQKGKTFYQEMKTTTKQTMKVMGMDVTQNQDQTFVFSWTPKDKDKAGNWEVTQKIEAVKMDIDIAGNKITYDSSNQQAGVGNPLADFFKALVGSEFTLTISPDMKIVKISGRDEFISKLAKANPQMEPLLKQILSDEALKQMAQPAFGAVPKGKVEKGKTWEDKATLNMGPIGTYDTTYKYTYEGKEGKLDKIKVDTTLNYQPPGANTSGTLPFKILSAKLTTKDATGTILFDDEKHRLDSSDMKLTLDGTLQIDIGGMNSPVNLTQEQHTTVKTSDNNPVKK